MGYNAFGSGFITLNVSNGQLLKESILARFDNLSRKEQASVDASSLKESIRIFYDARRLFVENESDPTQWVRRALEDVGFETTVCKDNPESPVIEVDFPDNKYFEESILDLLNDLAPLLLDGCIKFTGEDDAHWQFVFSKDHWEEQSGEVVYKGPSEPEPPICVLKGGVFCGIFSPQTGVEIRYNILDLETLAQAAPESDEKKEHQRLKNLLVDSGVVF